MRTSAKSAPMRSSMKLRVGESSGLPPPEPTTSCTGEASWSWSSSELTLWFPAVRWRCSTAAGLSGVRAPAADAESAEPTSSDRARLTESRGAGAGAASNSWACICGPPGDHRRAAAVVRNDTAGAAGGQETAAHIDCPKVQPPRGLSDETLAYRIRDRVRAVAQVQAAHHVVDRVFHGALGEEQLPPHLPGVHALGEQAQHLDLALRESGEGQATKRQHVPLKPPHLAQQAPQQVGRQGALSGRRGTDAAQQALGGGLAALEEAAGSGLHSTHKARVVDARGHDDDPLHAAPPQSAYLPNRLVVDLVGDQDRYRVLVQLSLVDELDALPAQLAGQAVPRDRVARGEEDGNPLSCRFEAGDDIEPSHLSDLR